MNKRMDGLSPLDFERLLGVPVVVVDPDSSSPCQASSLLEREGCQVRRLRTAEEALATVKMFAPTVVVTELVLPQMSGLLLARKLRCDSLTRNTIIVGLGAFDSRGVEEMAREAGCAAYIHKPIDAVAYVSTVATLLRNQPENGAFFR